MRACEKRVKRSNAAREALFGRGSLQKKKKKWTILEFFILVFTIEVWVGSGFKAGFTVIQDTLVMNGQNNKHGWLLIASNR